MGFGGSHGHARLAHYASSLDPGSQEERQAVPEHVEPEESDEDLLLDLSGGGGWDEGLGADGGKGAPYQEGEESEDHPEDGFGRGDFRFPDGAQREDHGGNKSAGSDEGAPVVDVGRAVVGEDADAGESGPADDSGGPQQVFDDFPAGAAAADVEVARGHHSGEDQREVEQQRGDRIGGPVLQHGQPECAQIILRPGVRDRVSRHGEKNQPGDRQDTTQQHQRVTVRRLVKI